MSIFPDNQPVIFTDDTDACACDLSYCQLVQIDDITQFQAKIYPCPGTLEELPAFQGEGWQAQGAFNIGRDGACKTVGSTGTLNYYNVAAIGTYYYLEVNTASIFGEVEVYSGGTLLGTITTTGIVGFAFLAANPNIRFYVGNSQHTVCLTSASLRELSDLMAVGVIDASGGLIASANIADTPAFFSLSKDTVTVAFSWGDITSTEGCYRIVFSEGCSGQFGTFNGDFTQWEEQSPRGWSESASTGSYTIERVANAGGILFTTIGAAASLSLQQDYDQYVVGTTYSIRLDIDSMKAGTTFQVDMGGNLSTLYNTAGVKNFNLVMGAGNYMKLLFDGPLSNDTIEIGSIRAKVGSGSEIVWDYTSNCFKLAQSWDCTHVVNFSQDEDAFGMVFEGNSFAPRMRLESRLVNSNYDSERVTYHDNLGKKRNHYFERRKIQYLKINFQPTYVHDFLSLCMGTDHFFIDGNPYFIEDEEYPATFPDEIEDLAPVILQVSKQTQLVRNVASGNSPNPIAANQDTFYIVDPSDRSIIITEPTTGDTLKSL